MTTIDQLIQRLKHPTSPLRFVFMGSSNTQRVANFGNAQNWVDWVDLGLATWYGKSHYSINVGISGQTSRDMLERFERDVMEFKPDVVFITGGGNDCNPVKDVSLGEFSSNLTAMVRRARQAGSLVVLQTYYSFDSQAMHESGEGARAENLATYMQLTRDVAAAEATSLIDHLPRWERLRLADLPGYRSLMTDPMHMSALGHGVFAADVLRVLGCDFTARTDVLPMIADAATIQRRLDELARQR